jgi:hypothetical protein
MTPLTVSSDSAAAAQGLAISPDGQHLYVSSLVTSSNPAIISEFNIGAGGALTLNPTQTLFGSTNLEGLAISPGGTSLYVADTVGNADQLSIAQGGNLAPMTPFTLTLGPAYSIAITPDQAPIAAFTTTPAAPGAATLLNAASSTASDGAPASYAWSFGDGSTGTTAGPLIEHTYAAAGAYAVTVTVTDDQGCSTSLVFTGRTALCNGGPGATVTQTVDVTSAQTGGAGGAPGPSGGSATPAPSITVVSVTHNRFRVSKRTTAIAASSHAIAAGTTFQFTLSVSAQLSIALEHRASGLRGASGCVGPTSRLRAKHAAHCSRTVIDGTLTRRSEPAGRDGLPFSGRIGNVALGRGSYTAVLSASDSGGRSPGVAVVFTIVG